jgi:hypothetical protein
VESEAIHETCARDEAVGAPSARRAARRLGRVRFWAVAVPNFELPRTLSVTARPEIIAIEYSFVI